MHCQTRPQEMNTSTFFNSYLQPRVQLQRPFDSNTSLSNSPNLIIIHSHFQTTATMPPIPLHTNSPINPAKASGITPQTTPPNNDQPTPTKTTSLPSSAAPNNGPPPPQPGAVPHLPQPTSFPASSTGPAPPQPAAAPATTAAPTYPPPPQSSIPSPELPYNQRGTSTAFTSATTTGAAVLPGPSPYETGGGQGYQQRTDSGYRPGGGEGNEEHGVLGSVMGYAKAAGEKLSEAEREVWRRINGEK
ncbi:uncharacterized protein QC764_708990 [Podospora pseudoanserina]|uniref:Uncharacterized protein n=1 Tax=Podospora pseudoanserina TaxID=2609844 RepID=A0ABR0HL44_9PEZI|nr:hypothetical protein QC764_708990 [Podospora pseudoanserina]